MSRIWYKLNQWNNTITPVGVEKETAQFVVIKGNRLRKAGEYFPTFKEARDAGMSFHAGQNESYKRQAEYAHNKWLKLFNQDEPDKEKQ